MRLLSFHLIEVTSQRNHIVYRRKIIFKPKITGIFVYIYLREIELISSIKVKDSNCCLLLFYKNGFIK